MHLDWLLNPITSYAAAAFCISISVALVVRMKLAVAQTSILPVVPELAAKPEDSEVRGLRAEMEQLRESVCRLEEAMPVRGSGLGLNLTKRAVALRMHHRGEPVAAIASTLETPSNEIALLLKVHALTEKKAS
jgi:hypothetical protein